jgi:hypothetical protein
MLSFFISLKLNKSRVKLSKKLNKNYKKALESAAKFVIEKES